MILTDCVFDRWSPGIGDPTVMGWVTVAAYGVAAILCFATFHRSGGKSVRFFWLVLAVLLAFLMINKQLDLQSALTAVGRCVSKMQGWYEERKPVQVLFIIGIIFASLIFGWVMFRAMRQHVRTTWLAMVGLVFLLSFVAVRAIGFHDFDVFIGLRIYNIRMNWVLELGGITMIAANAAWLILFPKHEMRAPKAL